MIQNGRKQKGKGVKAEMVVERLDGGPVRAQNRMSLRVVIGADGAIEEPHINAGKTDAVAVEDYDGAIEKAHINAGKTDAVAVEDSDGAHINIPQTVLFSVLPLFSLSSFFSIASIIPRSFPPFITLFSLNPHTFSCLFPAPLRSSLAPFRSFIILLLFLNPLSTSCFLSL